MTTALERFRAAPVHHLDLEGTQVAYRRFGQGPAVVMVHGWPMSGVTYRGLIEHLHHDFTLYVPDLPGAGASPQDASITEMFTDCGTLVRRFADALELDRLALIGHDSGGTMARIAAAQMPGRVTALALTNTEVPGHLPRLVRVFQIMASIPGAAALFRVLLRSPAYCRSALGFGGAFADTAFIEGEFRQVTLDPLIRGAVVPAMAALRNADLSITRRLQAIHDQIDAPLLAIWGDRDPFFPASEARAMVEAWPGEARLELIEGHKLLVHEEQPQRVAALMAPFLRAHGSAGPSHAISA